MAVPAVIKSSNPEQESIALLAGSLATVGEETHASETANYILRRALLKAKGKHS